jgi:hypothetical protein
MKRSGLLGLGVGLAGMLMAGHVPVARAQGGAIRCESQDGRFRQCAIPWDDAALVRQESKGACIRGESWGVDERGLWVDHGCRGVFGPAPRGWAGRGDRRGRDDGRYGRPDWDRAYPNGARDDDRGGWRPGRDWDRAIRLDCHSNQSRYQLCQVDVGRHGHVTLERQVSDAACREGYSWGWNRAGVWVAHGCRAQFVVDRRW